MSERRRHALAMISPRPRHALAMISAVDDGLGNIMNKLDEHGIGENTPIFDGVGLLPSGEIVPREKA
jgi:hypothetical protein